MIEGQSEDNSIDLFDQFIEYDPDQDQSEDVTDNFDVANTENKENILEESVSKPRKARKNQFLSISAFMNEHNEQSIDKGEYDRKWLTLCSDLNNAGPPKYTAHEWKTKWTSHVYNVKKRKRSSKDSSCDKHTPSIPMDIAVVSGIGHNQDKSSQENICISHGESSRLIKVENITIVHEQCQSSDPENISRITYGDSSPTKAESRSSVAANIDSSYIHDHHDDSNVSGMLKDDVLIGQRAIINRLDLVIERLDKSNEFLEKLVKGKK